ncbi:hypothetical protein SHKM778_05360 [Streptomyces sp. KM77-8]|uniref:DUF4232 domain-containing protein n=1 Tax=Streptomyces haneummycinicus TaxID=3074435 RepID=A0AAT9H9S8_9ACTN
MRRGISAQSGRAASSTIYWRRRAVLLSVLALLALLITWIVVSGGGGGNDRDPGANGKNPAPSIVPGPSSSGPAISQAPGGRDESGSGGSDGGGAGASDGSSSGSGDDGANGDPADSGGGTGGGSEGGTAAGVGAGDALPAGSGASLPNCTPKAVKFSLRSYRNAYAPAETPTFLLTARNISGGDCKIDLGPGSAVLTITPASGDEAYWASDDCPEGSGAWCSGCPRGQHHLHGEVGTRAECAEVRDAEGGGGEGGHIPGGGEGPGLHEGADVLRPEPRLTVAAAPCPAAAAGSRAAGARGSPARGARSGEGERSGAPQARVSGIHPRPAPVASA